MRLTKYSKKLGYCSRNSSIKPARVWNKLGRLENQEDEIGMDLELYVALTTNVIYVLMESENFGVKKVEAIPLVGLVYDVTRKMFLHPCGCGHLELKLNELDKTWGLYKEVILRYYNEHKGEFATPKVEMKIHA